MQKISKRFLKLTILVITVLVMLPMLPINAAEEQDTDITQLLKEFQVEDNPIDYSIINSNTNITADGMDTLDNALFTIFMEPAVSDYYDKICPLFEKSNISGIQMFVDGQQIDFTKYDNVYPSIIDGRVLVPLRAIGENLGAEVEWIAKDKLIRIKLNDKVVEIVVDSKDALINSKKTTLDVPAKIIDGRTLVPARFISESFSKTVEWHSYNKELGVIAIY
ncbi:copper amine oxidase N-terminal domain-containing protein [Acetivibrio cellulolyticus]|uniref:copper amine oxidase N-terminal domain-containing protein n=1 Tax=Acetivibrio cellulolyticus TaxID=35830 RepID=UPI0001E2C20D|nr:copper amine oxidase N-terminal domain-containing protein [Acetivibrio cellulolyticus]